MLNSYLHLDMDYIKPKKHISKKAINFLILEEKNLLTIKKFVKGQENYWSIILNFIDFKDKKYFYYIIKK